MDGILESLCNIVNNPYKEDISKNMLLELNSKLEMYDMETLNFPSSEEALKSYYTFCQGVIKNILRNASIYKLSKKEAIKKIIEENNSIISYEDLLETGETIKKDEFKEEELGIREKFRLMQKQEEIINNLNEKD